MTTGELVTAVADYHVNQGGSQSADTALRARATFFAQKVVTKFYNFFRPFSWTLGTGTVTLNTGANAGFGDLPDDFASAGPKLKVFLDGQTYELTYCEPGEFMSRRRMTPSTSDKPYFYTFRGGDADGDRYIHVYPTNSTAIVLRLENYRRVRPVLVDRPGRPTLEAGIAGNLSGAYTYKITFVTADGETEGGATSSSLTVTSKKIELTDIAVSPLAEVTSRKIYRTIGGGTQHKLVATLSDNTTTTYSDNVADGSLGANVPAAATAVSGLERIPRQYHDGLLYDATVLLMMRGQGDGRSSMEMPQAVMAAMAQAWNEENMHHIPRRTARYGARAFSGR